MNKLGKKRDKVAYLYILPLIVLFFVLVYYCIINTVVVSFTDWDGMWDVFGWVGIKNYGKMLTDGGPGRAFWRCRRSSSICSARDFWYPVSRPGR